MQACQFVKLVDIRTYSSIMRTMIGGIATEAIHIIPFYLNYDPLIFTV